MPILIFEKKEEKMATKGLDFPINLRGTTDALQQDLNNAGTILENFNKKSKGKGLMTSLNQADKALARIIQRASNPITSPAAFTTLKRDCTSIEFTLKGMNKQLEYLKTGTEKDTTSM